MAQAVPEASEERAAGVEMEASSVEPTEMNPRDSHQVQTEDSWEA